MSNNTWRGEQIVIYPFYEILVGNKKELIIDSCYNWINHEIIMLGQRSQVIKEKTQKQKGKIYRLCNSIHIKFWRIN